MLEFMRIEKHITEEFYNWLIENGFKTAPASTKYHGDFEGGLYEHSKNVVEELCRLTTNLNLHWDRLQSPYIVGMFHDLCKIDQYIKVNDEPRHVEAGNKNFVYKPLAPYEYNDKMPLKGHGEKSVMLLSRFMTLTEEEIFCIRYHMGAYIKEDWDSFDLAIKKYPNVLFTHTADMLASKLKD